MANNETSGKVFRLGLVGAGGISSAHIAAVKASEGRLAIVAVADPVESARNKAAAETGARAFESFDSMALAMAGDLRIDGLLVCTPPSARLKIVKKALKVKVPILTEKPIAHTLAEGKKIAALAGQHKKRVAAVGFCHRFAPAIVEMKRLVADGKIGRLVRFENVFACDLPGHSDKWFSDPKRAGGGAALDMGSHSIDLFHFLVGPAKVAGSVADSKWKGRSETAATILLKSTKASNKFVKAGVAGVVLSGWAETCRFELSLVGDAGMLSYNYEKPTELVFRDLSGKAESTPIESHEVRFKNQLLAFADAVSSKAKTNLATFGDGVAVSAINTAAGKNAR